MELFGSSLVDMMERDMKDSVYDAVYYPSLGSSPLFPDLVWPVGPLDSSLDQLDAGIMIDPAVVVPKRQTEHQHLSKPTPTKEEYILPDIISHSKLRVELEETSEEDEDLMDDEEEDKIIIKKTLQMNSQMSSRMGLLRRDDEGTERKKPTQWTMMVNKKIAQKGLNTGVIKVKREQVRSPSLTRSPSSHSVRSPSISVRSPSTHSVRSPSISVRSPSAQTVRSPSTHSVRSPSAQAVRSPSTNAVRGANSLSQTVRVKSPEAGSPDSAYGKAYQPMEYPKPTYSYSCLIAMALKNSPSGSLPVSEIYNFMCEHFPYFKTAPSGWKNSVRHNLSLNKCFEKIEKTIHGGSRKGCLWALNPVRMAKMDEEVAKWRKKDPEAIKQAMAHPETLDRLEQGEMKIKLVIKEEDEEEDDEEDLIHRSNELALLQQQHMILKQEEEEELEQEDVHQELVEEDVSEESEQDDQSDEEGEVPPSLKPFDRQLNSRLHPALEQTDIGVEFSEEVYEELGLLEEVLEEEEYKMPAKRCRSDEPIQRHATSRPVSQQQRYRHPIASLH